MSRTFFERWFPNEPEHGQGFFTELSRVLPAAGRVLDLGCGANYHLAFFRTAEREVWGTDLQVHPRLAHPEWFRPMPPDGTIPFADDTFDLVATFLVLEHVARPDRFLREAARVLRPGGHLIAHTISALHYAAWLRRLSALSPYRVVRRLCGRDEGDGAPLRCRLNTPARLARLAEPLGLAPVRLQRYACPAAALRGVLGCGAIVADWALERLWPGLGRRYFTATFAKRCAREPARPAATRVRMRTAPCRVGTAPTVLGPAGRG